MRGAAATTSARSHANGHAFAPSNRLLLALFAGSAGPTRAGYLPADEETNLATAVICAALRLPLNAGITPPPTVTWCWTIACEGFSWSRFGPIVPCVPAAASVWQLEHSAWKIVLPSVPSCDGGFAFEIGRA